MSEAGKEDKNNNDALIVLYNEICKSYHAIDSYRMKLLSFLPFFSIVGILFIDNTIINSNELIAFISTFASLFTIALFIYEIRGIRRSDNLIKKGMEIESELGFEAKGQFHVCEKEYANNPLFTFNATFAACLIYSLVFAAWLYIFLEYGSEFQTSTCVFSAAIAGILISIFSNYQLNKRYISA